MSSVIRPSGPLPPRVYWLRRLALLVVVVLLLYALLQLLGGEQAPAAGGEPGPSAVPRQAVAEDTANDSNRPGRQGKDRQQAKQEQQTKQEQPPKQQRPTKQPQRKRGPGLAKPDGPCRPGDVLVRPVVSAGNEAGDLVEIRLRMRTSDRPACTLSVGPDNLVVRVTSGSDRIWISDECPDAIWPSDLVIRRAKAVTYRVSWSGHRSAPRCPLQTEAALPGTYVAAAAIIGGEPAETRFLLE